MARSMACTICFCGPGSLGGAVTLLLLLKACPQRIFHLGAPVPPARVVKPELILTVYECQALSFGAVLIECPKPDDGAATGGAMALTI